MLIADWWRVRISGKLVSNRLMIVFWHCSRDGEGGIISLLFESDPRLKYSKFENIMLVCFRTSMNENFPKYFIWSARFLRGLYVKCQSFARQGYFTEYHIFFLWGAIVSNSHV